MNCRPTAGTLPVLSLLPLHVHLETATQHFVEPEVVETGHAPAQATHRFGGSLPHRICHTGGSFVVSWNRSQECCKQPCKQGAAQLLGKSPLNTCGTLSL